MPEAQVKSPLGERGGGSGGGGLALGPRECPGASGAAPLLSEREILRLIARGLSNKEIAKALGIRPSTVKTHVESLLEKLGASDRTEAAVKALRGLQLRFRLAPNNETAMIDSPAQLIAILVVALLLFGPRKLPELARGLGQSVREFKRSMEGVVEEVKEEAKPPEAPKPPEAKAEEPKKG